MELQPDKKFTWVIKDFSSLQSKKIYSDIFVVGRCRWRLLAYPKGDNKPNYLSLYLAVADTEILPIGWRIQAKASFTIVNQVSDKLSENIETQVNWFDQKGLTWGIINMINLTEVNAKEGFLVNGELIVVAEVDVLEVEGELEESSPVMETVDVNGFQVLPSQVESVNRLFERHHDIASKFRAKNPFLKTANMNLLLSLTQTLHQSPQQISKNDLAPDLADQYAALAYLTGAGFELDWLKKKLDKIKEMKEKEEACLARLQEMEEQLQPLKQKFSDLEAQIDKEKAGLSIARGFSHIDDVA